MKNVFTYSLIGLSLSLISCSKNNSANENKKDNFSEKSKMVSKDEKDKKIEKNSEY